VWYWLFIAVLALGIWALVVVILYLNPVFPSWDYFRPIPGQPEGPSELRMWNFSAGIATLVALCFVVLAALRRFRTACLRFARLLPPPATIKLHTARPAVAGTERDTDPKEEEQP
jgi:hypothetical protein